MVKARSDILVVGAGAVGLTAAVALARAGRDVTLLGRPSPVRPGRTVALLQGSVDLLRAIGVWPAIEADAEPLRTMRIVDATGSLFTPPPVAFRAEEIGLEAFGYNIDNARLETALRDAASRTPGLDLVAEDAKAIRFGSDDVDTETDEGRHLRGALAVAADGRDSMLRKAARIGVRATEHPQRALTAVFTHTAPHHDISTEFHTRQGPFTLVPMPGHDRHRSSLVWVMAPAEAERRRALTPEAFAREAERQGEHLLGRMAVEGAVGSFPIVTRTATRLVGPRLVLVGEAAHALPPIGAQGLNLSFRDVEVLVRHLRADRSGDRNPGAPARLAAYARARKADVATRAMGVDLLNGSLLARGPGADVVRGLGLMALGRITPLRKLVMRHGVAPGSGRGIAPSA